MPWVWLAAIVLVAAGACRTARSESSPSVSAFEGFYRGRVQHDLAAYEHYECRTNWEAALRVMDGTATWVFGNSHKEMLVQPDGSVSDGLLVGHISLGQFTGRLSWGWGPFCVVQFVLPRVAVPNGISDFDGQYVGPVSAVPDDPPACGAATKKEKILLIKRGLATVDRDSRAGQVTAAGDVTLSSDSAQAVGTIKHGVFLGVSSTVTKDGLHCRWNWTLSKH